MICKECRHVPHTFRITFDVGHGQITAYELCESCKELDVFSENVLNIEEIKN